MLDSERDWPVSNTQRPRPLPRGRDEVASDALQDNGGTSSRLQPDVRSK